MQTRRAVNDKGKDENGEIVIEEKGVNRTNLDGESNNHEHVTNHQDQNTNNNIETSSTTSSQPHPAQIPHVTADEIANNLFLSTMAEENNNNNNGKHNNNIHPIHNSISNLTSDSSSVDNTSVVPRSSFTSTNGEKLQNLSTTSVLQDDSQRKQDTINVMYSSNPTKAEENPTSCMDGQRSVSFPATNVAVTNHNNVSGVGNANGPILSFEEKVNSNVNEPIQTDNREAINETNDHLHFNHIPMSNPTSFDHNPHSQMVQIPAQGGAMQHNNLSSYCQSAPPTVTSFNTSNPNIGSPTHGNNSLYHSNYYTPYHSNYGQQFVYPPQQQQQQTQPQHGQHQSYDHSFTGHPEQQNQLAHHNANFMHGQSGMDPPPFFSGGNSTNTASCDSEVGKGFPHHGHLGGVQNQPHHYYHNSIPIPTEDLRRSASATRLGSSNYQPYTVPTQLHNRSGSQNSSNQPIPTSSIFMANPDNFPDLRFNPGAMHSGASYGRLPDGKIIELFPAMMRTVQACEYCRSRKAKCTGGLPCERCSKKKIKCEYAQLDKKRKIKTTTSEYDMSSGAARMAANRTIEQAQAQLSAKIGMKNDKNGGELGYYGEHHSTSSSNRNLSNRDMRMTKSTSGLNISFERGIGRGARRSDSLVRLAIDPIGEEVDENISAQVTFAKPRFTAPVIISDRQFVNSNKIEEGNSPKTDTTDETGFESSIAINLQVGEEIERDDDDEGEFFFESARTTYSNFPIIHQSLPGLDLDGDDDQHPDHARIVYT